MGYILVKLHDPIFSPFVTIHLRYDRQTHDRHLATATFH